MSLPNPDPHPVPEPQNLKTLRRLVTGLTATMILGITGIFILMALRLTTPAAPPLPDQIALPAGITATGFTQTPSYIAITAQDRILIYAPDGTTLRQTIKLTQP